MITTDRGKPIAVAIGGTIEGKRFLTELLPHAS